MTRQGNEQSWHGGPPQDLETARSRLVLAAETCFTKRGVRRKTIEDIANEAGLHRTTVYEYFANRDQIVTAVAVRLAQQIANQASKQAGAMAFAPGLVRSIAVGTALIRKSPVLSSEFSPDLEGQNIQTAVASRVWTEGVRSGLTKSVHRAVETGEVRTDVEVDELVDWVGRAAFSVTWNPPSDTIDGVETYLTWFLLPALLGH